jgi:hypothetical protein
MSFFRGLKVQIYIGAAPTFITGPPPLPMYSLHPMRSAILVFSDRLVVVRKDSSTPFFSHMS